MPASEERQMYATLVLFSAAVVAALDQLAKVFVVSKLSAGHNQADGWIVLRGVLNKTGVKRTGYWMVLLLLEAAWLAGTVQLVPVFHNAIAPLALGAALGGAASNVGDRVWRGGVVDFIDVRFWPVFNLADVAIVLGVALAVLSL